jgi:hypothetical protein
MLKLALAAALVAVPGVAAAQSVSTSCHWGKKSARCTSTYRPSISEQIRELTRPGPYRGIDPKIYAEGQRILAERAARGEGPTDPPNHSPDHQRFVVADFIGSGDCPGARLYATKTKNPATVARVEEICGKETSQ